MMNISIYKQNSTHPLGLDVFIIKFTYGSKWVFDVTAYNYEIIRNDKSVIVKTTGGEFSVTIEENTFDIYNIRENRVLSIPIDYDGIIQERLFVDEDEYLLHILETEKQGYMLDINVLILVRTNLINMFQQLSEEIYMPILLLGSPNKRAEIPIFAKTTSIEGNDYEIDSSFNYEGAILLVDKFILTSNKISIDLTLQLKFLFSILSSTVNEGLPA